MIEAKQLEASAVIDDEACTHVDESELCVRGGESCVMLEIRWGAPDAKVKLPLLLSAAASRELAANLMKIADKLEPR